MPADLRELLASELTQVPRYAWDRALNLIVKRLPPPKRRRKKAS